MTWEEGNVGTEMPPNQFAALISTVKHDFTFHKLISK